MDIELNETIYYVPEEKGISQCNVVMYVNNNFFKCINEKNGEEQGASICNLHKAFLQDGFEIDFFNDDKFKDYKKIPLENTQYFDALELSPENSAKVIRNTKDRISNLTDRVGDLTLEKQQMERDHAQNILNLQQQLTQLTTQKEELEAQLEKQETNLTQLKTRLKTQDFNILALDQQIQELEELRDTNQTSIKDLTTRLRTSTEQCNGQIINLGAEIKRLEEANRQITAQLTTLNDEKNVLEGEQLDLTNRLNDLTEQVRTLNEDKTRLQADKDELNGQLEVLKTNNSKLMKRTAMSYMREASYNAYLPDPKRQRGDDKKPMEVDRPDNDKPVKAVDPVRKRQRR